MAAAGCSNSSGGGTTSPNANLHATGSTASGSSSDPTSVGYHDPATNLVVGARATPPPGVVVPHAPVQTASISVEGDFPLSLSDGQCSLVDGYIYIQAGDVGGTFITLSFQRDGNVATSPGLGWQTDPQNTALAGVNDIEIALDSVGTSGTFHGTGVVKQQAQQPYRTNVSGRFTCTPLALGIQGDHPLRLNSIRCAGADESSISAGNRSGNAALLAIDPASIQADGTFDGSLTWRVDGQSYQTLWLSGQLSADRVSANFIGQAEGSDGSQFEVTGGFTCAQ